MTEKTQHLGKYRALWEHLKRQDADVIFMTFADIETVLNFALPPSCRSHTAHWFGYKGSAVARAIFDAGRKAEKVNLTDESVTFVRR